MKTNLNINNFLEYAYATEKYNQEQLGKIEDALYMLEDDMAHVNFRGTGTVYSVRYMDMHLSETCKKLKVFLMSAGLRQTTADKAVKDFRKWMETVPY